MNTKQGPKVEMIPIDQITVVNPRARGRGKFKQIVDNIATIGLKRPVTVSVRKGRNGKTHYDLVCGQGRLEAFQALGQTEVPAFVVKAAKDEVMLMSLAENLARRVRSAPELMTGISALKDRGYTHAEIAKKTALTTNYVRGVLRLMTKGEERLIRAVEDGVIPIGIAITIASSDDEEVQRALADAYAQNKLRGKDLIKARRLIDKRRACGKRMRTQGPRSRRGAGGEALLREYEKETSRQKLLVRQARACETRLQFVVAGLRKLLAEPAFVKVLQGEKLAQMPKPLAALVDGEGRAD